MTDLTQIDALIVAHGQPSAPTPAEEALAAFTTLVQGHCPNLLVGSATMANPGVLEEALQRLSPEGVVYPLFMANGWFVRSALRKRLGGRADAALPPLGLEPDLVDLAAGVLRQAFDGAALAENKAKVLLAAHGSGRGKAAAEAANDFADNLSAKMDLGGIATAFVEEAPFLPDVASDYGANGVCLPFFAMAGDHVKQDVREGLMDNGFGGILLPALGQAEGVPALVARSLQAALSGVVAS